MLIDDYLWSDIFRVYAVPLKKVQEFLAPYGDRMTTFAVEDLESFNLPGPPLYEDGDGEEWMRQVGPYKGAHWVQLYSIREYQVFEILHKFVLQSPLPEMQFEVSIILYSISISSR